MCLAIPGRIVEIETDAAGVRMARANFGGIVKQVCLEYTPEAVKDDYVLVHVGFALSVVDAAEAARTLAALEDLGQLDELKAGPAEPVTVPHAGGEISASELAAYTRRRDAEGAA